jgi:transcriptional regulator with XRE-family HTH domain
MKKSNLLEKLRVRRELLDFSQDYMGILMNMSQPAYSLIENGQTRLTDELLEKIKTIEGFEGFDEETPLPVEHLAADERIPLWPWGRTSLNSTIVIVVLLLLNLASMFADDVSRGFGVGAEPDAYVTLIIAVVLLALFVGIIYLLFRLAKWLLNLRRM